MLSRAMRADRQKKPAIALSQKLGDFYASRTVSTWQKQRIEDIRDVYKEKQQGLDVAHNIASSKLAEEYMGFELEYLETSDRLKERDGGEPYHHDWRAVYSRAFWRAMGRKASGFFSTLHGQEA